MKKITAVFGALILLFAMTFSVASAKEAQTASSNDDLIINNGDSFAALLKPNTLTVKEPSITGAPANQNNSVSQNTTNTYTLAQKPKYKFVYSFNNWKDWGVIRDFGTSNSAKWTPQKAGTYKIYVDIDDNGKITTKEFSVKVKRAWSVKSIDTGNGLYLNRASKITVNTTGNENLQYKFVYSYNNWQDWKVIKNFSSSNVVSFTPKQLGKYEIYVDVKDAYGNEETNKVAVESTLPWEFKGVETGGQIELLDSARLFANVSGETEKLEYKFVYSLNNWKEWGVIKSNSKAGDFSSSQSVSWTPKKAGKYDIYVDVKDKEGNVVTKKATLKVIDEFSFDKIELTDKNGKAVTTVKADETVNITPVVSGAVKRLEYKFVYSYENWKKWGVIKRLDSTGTGSFTPKTPGKYDIYVDVKDRKGNTVTKKASLRVVPYYMSVKASSSKLKVGDTFKVNITGAPDGAEFKVVTEYNGWKNWYVEKKSAKNSSIELVAKHPGELKVYIDSTYKGYTHTETSQKINVESTWNFESMTCPAESEMNKTVNVSAKVTGKTKGLKFKYVYSYENWKSWGIIKDFNTAASCNYTLKNHGNYRIYIDVQDEYGNVVTKSEPLYVKPDWEFVSVLTSTKNVDEGGKAVIKPYITGNTEGLTYKYVYSYYNWKLWGVLDNGTNKQIEFRPTLIGSYRIYVDVTDRQGYTVTKSVDITYQDAMFPIQNLDWSVVNSRLPKGRVYLIIDVYTGKRFKVKRLFGSKHLDAEPLTANDTAIMKEVYGGEWSWDRRPILVVDEENLVVYAASMNGMPHGSSKSDQSIYDNNFNGHFCIHFKNSRTHGSNKVCPKHQAAVATAAKVGRYKIY